MKKYKVNVNGTAYEVEIEEMTGAPTVAAAPVAASAAAPAASGAGESITSPMPGNMVPSRFMRKIVCRLRLNEVSRSLQTILRINLDGTK